MTKQQLGQFFTKEADYIFQGFERYVRGERVSDPFAGGQDLMLWAQKHGAKNVKGYDVDKKYRDGKKVSLNDSLLNPRKYQFVVTNPPYLNINKATRETKELYFKNAYYEDLYQISLQSIMESNEGIVIVPINFLSAENAEKIRDYFFSKFYIDEMNYFREQVFADTTYNVIAFHYKKWGTAHLPSPDTFTIMTHIYPEEQNVAVKLDRKYHWTIGGALTAGIKKYDNVLGARRLVEKDLTRHKGMVEVPVAYNHVSEKKRIGVSRELYQKINSNIILLKAIDSGTPAGKIALEDIRRHGVCCLVSKPTSRHMIYILFENDQPTVSEQERIIALFNQEINRMRKDNLSLFLTNYRDKDRKRISFDFVYKFINYLYFNKVKPGAHASLFT